MQRRKYSKSPTEAARPGLGECGQGSGGWCLQTRNRSQNRGADGVRKLGNEEDQVGECECGGEVLRRRKCAADA